MSGVELFQKISPAHLAKQSLYIKSFLLQVLEVYPLPRDKSILRESLCCIINIVDGWDASGLILPRGAIVHREFKEKESF